MSFRCECPFCHQHYEAEDQDKDITITCASCYKDFCLSSDTVLDKGSSHPLESNLPIRLCRITFFICIIILSVLGVTIGAYCIHLRALDTHPLDLRKEKSLTIDYTVVANDPKQAEKKAYHSVLCELSRKLQNWDIPLEDSPNDAKENLSQIITKSETTLQDETNRTYKVSIQIDIEKLKQFIPYYWFTADIDSKDIQNIISQRSFLKMIEDEITDLFDGLSSRLYIATRKGMFEVSQQDRTSETNAEMRMTYSLQFNINEYKKFEKRLKNLLSKVAIAEKSGQGTYEEIYSYGGFVPSFARSAQKEKWPEGTAIISFCDEYIDGEAKKYQYCIYAVPMQIYQKIDQLTLTYSILVFDFKLKGEEKPIQCYTTSRLAFFDHDTYGGVESFEFLSWMKRDGNSFSQKDFTITFKFSEEQIRSMETCTIKIYTGNQASYLCNSFDKDEYAMRGLARNGYLPAMIAMVEQFDETKTWYHRAALLGSTHAQEKVEWENGGLGFEIIPSDNRFMVGTVRKGVPVNRGLYIKSINGTEFKYTGDRSIDELSNYIGKLSPETSVSVEFTNGNKIDVKVQEQ